MKLKKYIVIISIFLFSFNFLSVQADVVGQAVNFNVNPNFDKYKRTSLDTTLRYSGENVYFYVENNYWNGLSSTDMGLLMSNIKLLASEFDNNIYIKETSFFGSEPNPGVDNDPKLTILLEELIDNNGGYFDTVNSYSKSKIDSSNQREMLALNVDVLVSDLFVSKMFLAHEFQHLISFNQKEKAFNISEEAWLNELRSEYAITVAGYNNPYPNSNLNRRAFIFSNNQTDSLTEWPNTNQDYATAALFAEYLVEQYGDKILSETLKSPIVGISSLGDYFLKNGYYEGFNDVFLNWLGALYLNDISKNPKLGYAREELKSIKANPQEKIFLSSNLREYHSLHQLKDWQPLWLEYDISSIAIDQTKSARIDINGDASQNFTALLVAFYEDGKIETSRINTISGSGNGFISNTSKKLSKLAVIITKSTKLSKFGKIEQPSPLNIKVSMIDTRDAQAGSLRDGMLIRRLREKEIYVIWGKYKRYLNPGVISLYGHLDPSAAIELEPELFNSYQTSNYVKYVNDEKVYAVWPDSTKHWLNITPSQWDASHRDWNAIFTINDLELNHYKTGANITR